MTNNRSFPFFSKLIEDPASIIASYLHPKDLISLTLVNHDCQTLFSKNLSFLKLLHCITLGQPVQAEAIVKKNPEFLVQYGTIVDKSERTHKHATPLTLAYGADDIELCLTLLPYLIHIKDGYKIALKQMMKAFPTIPEEKIYDFTPLVTAITGQDKDVINHELEQFRENFKPVVLKNGKHFNIYVLIHAYRIYAQHYQIWSHQQCSIFWKKVIGYLQKLLPACYAEAYCQDLSNFIIFDEIKPLQRSLQLSNNHFFYIGSLESRTGLGFDFAVYSPVHPSIPKKNPAHTTWGYPLPFQTEIALENLAKTKLIASKHLFQLLQESAIMKLDL